MPNILDQGERLKYIQEIKAEENMQRKEDSKRAFEIYKSRQENFILNKLREEFNDETVKNMRTMTSINLTRRVIDELASIYRNEPDRTYEGVSDAEQEQLDNLYEMSKADVMLKKANKYFKLFSQCAIQVIPKDGVIGIKVLMPHHYDVIPDPNDPEKPWIYIVNILDATRLLDRIDQPEVVSKLRLSGVNKNLRDGVNQGIADNEDFKADLERYVWWSADMNFTTNGKGQLINPETDQPGAVAPEQMVNPLGELPFVDVAAIGKDFEFWVREVHNVVSFTEDFGVLLSDTSDINRLQGYSQAVVNSVDQPSIQNIGPHKILWLPQDPNAAVQPSFQFVSPSPDLGSSLNLLETYLRLFLTSNGIDPKVISGSSDAQRFGSGVERLLAMIEKFEATKDDIDLFRCVEMQVFDLMVKWSNLFQSVEGPLELVPELQISTINEEAELNVNFQEPSVVQTKVEKEDSDIKLIDAGLMSKKEAIMSLRDVSEEEAEKILEEIDNEGMPSEPVIPPAFNNGIIPDGGNAEDPNVIEPPDAVDAIAEEGE